MLAQRRLVATAQFMVKTSPLGTGAQQPLRRPYSASTPTSIFGSTFHSAPAQSTWMRSLLQTRSISTPRSNGSTVLASPKPFVTTTKAGTAVSPSLVATAKAFTAQRSNGTSSPSSSSSSFFFTRKYTSPSSSSPSPSNMAVATATATTNAASSTVVSKTLKKPLSFHEEMTKDRFSFNWWKEWTIIMGVFAVTGSSTVIVVRPLLNDVFKLKGSMREGPWSFRIAYLSTTLPLYSCVLLTIASLVGRRPYFKMVVMRMWGRFLPKKVIQRFQ